MYLVICQLSAKLIPKYNAIPILKAVIFGTLQNGRKSIVFEQIPKGGKNCKSDEQGQNLLDSEVHYKPTVTKRIFNYFNKTIKNGKDYLNYFSM